MGNKANKKEDELYEGREKYFMDIDRMINEGLGGGLVTKKSGSAEQSEEFPKREAEPSKDGRELQ